MSGGGAAAAVAARKRAESAAAQGSGVQIDPTDQIHKIKPVVRAQDGRLNVLIGDNNVSLNIKRIKVYEPLQANIDRKFPTAVVKSVSYNDYFQEVTVVYSGNVRKDSEASVVSKVESFNGYALWLWIMISLFGIVILSVFLTIFGYGG